MKADFSGVHVCRMDMGTGDLERQGEESRGCGITVDTCGAIFSW